jgi:peptidoglycan hydrolase-like protein with peptidoglycan-binding domain
VGGVETQRAPPNGPPPLLSAGDDDIYWVSKLHAALGGAGYYAPDGEAEDFYFGEGTAAALLSYQACQGLPETGVTDDATWAALLGSDAVASGGGGGAEAQQQQQDGAASASSSSSNGSGSSSTTAAAAAADAPPRTTWPVVMDGDGGREVHALHVALGRAGFHCGEDDMRWWMFGDPTGNALRTFQASSKLPESGVCDERTWLALLGAGAQPRMVDELKADDSEFEDDMAAPHEGAVWLLGEQRWSRPV